MRCLIRLNTSAPFPRTLLNWPLLFVRRENEPVVAFDDCCPQRAEIVQSGIRLNVIRNVRPRGELKRVTLEGDLGDLGVVRWRRIVEKMILAERHKLERINVEACT